jgi:hypothetical protein
MRIPALRLVDDESARESCAAVLKRCADTNYQPRGFEWPLIRSVLDARYGRMQDTSFAFGFTAVMLGRWLVRGRVYPSRRWWIAPLYAGLVSREFALADNARKCHYADFMILASGIDSPLGTYAREELKSKGQNVEKPYPELANGLALKEKFSPRTTKRKGNRDNWERNMSILFPSISRIDQTVPGDAKSAGILSMVALCSRFALLHTICDVFGGSAFYESYADLNRPDPPLFHDCAQDTSRKARAERIAQQAHWERLDAKLPTAKRAAKKKVTNVATDLIVLRVSTRWFDWAPLEIMRCERGEDNSHIFSVSAPRRPPDSFTGIMASPTVRGWFANGPQPTLASVWWMLHMPAGR